MTTAKDIIGDFDFGFDREQIVNELTISYEANLRLNKYKPTAELPTHKLAVQMAEERAGELIKSISETTRTAAKDAVAKTLADGGTIRDISNAIRSLPELNDNRATLIARTEASYANGRATVQAYESRGISKKQWLSSGEADDDCADLDGKIVDVGDTFSNGDMAPPAHPQCRCTLLPVRDE